LRAASNRIAFGFFEKREIVILYAKRAEIAMILQTQHDPKNEAEITYWNSAGGRRWVERQHSDIVLGPILQATLERAQLRWGERVVDIGCGTGASSIALPSALPSERVLGVDISAPMLAGGAERLPLGAPVKFVRAPSA
jgi:trans-aconitate methyltransferase